MKAHDYTIRRKVIDRWRGGDKLISISTDLGLSYSTVREYIKRYKSQGESGLSPNYNNCGRPATYSQAVIDEACDLKELHQDWGAPYILMRMDKTHASHTLPTARRLQQIFKQRGLSPHRTTRKDQKGSWAEHPLDCVQVDAKERLQTADGQHCCYLNFVDEKTGSELDAFLFPLSKNK